MGGRRAIRMLVAGLTALAVAASITASASAADVAITEEQAISDRLLELTVTTPAIAEPTKVHVFLPTGYEDDPGKKWPVTYFLAGTQNRYSSLANFLSGESLTKDFPSIIVSPDGRSGYWSDWFNDGKYGTPQYETYVIDQLIPLIDQRFRTKPERAQRAIFGISMGGYGVMSLAARHPDLFGSAATLSGAVDSNLPTTGGALSLSSVFDGGAIDAINGPRETEEVRWRSRNPVDLAVNLRGMDVQVLTANGVLNPEIGEGSSPNDELSCVVERGVYEASISFHERLLADEVPHLWKDYGVGCHTVPNFTREVEDTLKRFTSNFAEPVAAPKTFSYRSIEPKFNVWGWQFETDSARALEFLNVEAGSRSVVLEGSGKTKVRTPGLFPGLKRVAVGGKAVRPTRDGRLVFTVNLGPAHTVQQYRVGAEEKLTRKQVVFKPYAVVKNLTAKRVRGGLRVCARSVGGTVPKATIKAGKLRVGFSLKAKQTCRKLRMKKLPKRVVIQGKDRYGHSVKASVKLRRF